jgi:hypothetical protein
MGILKDNVRFLNHFSRELDGLSLNGRDAMLGAYFTTEFIAQTFVNGKRS